jgi:hypothetical protein
MLGSSQMFKIKNAWNLPNVFLKDYFDPSPKKTCKLIFELKLSEKFKNGHTKFLTHQDFLKFEEKSSLLLTYFKTLNFSRSFLNLILIHIQTFCLACHEKMCQILYKISLFCTAMIVPRKKNHTLVTVDIEVLTISCLVRVWDQSNP